jgi:AraC-like DNA-binding protein
VKLKDSSGTGFAEWSRFPPDGQRAEPHDIWKARRFIEEYAAEHISLAKVARTIGINSTHLSEKFKQVTGTKFVDYVARTRFEKARELLEDVGLRISEIAFTVGFQSLSQFNRVFKKLSGKSPSQYRAMNLRRRKLR